MKSLQVFAFGVGHQKRVVNAAAEAADGPSVHLGVKNGARNDLLEEIDVHRARAREREELAAGQKELQTVEVDVLVGCLLYTSPSPRDGLLSRMPSSA